MILVATRHTTLGRFRGQNADTPDKTKIPNSCDTAAWDFSGTCSQYDNDLKDHHAPMKGEALPKRQVRERRIRQQSRLLLDKHNFLMIKE